MACCYGIASGDLSAHDKAPTDLFRVLGAAEVKLLLVCYYESTR